MPEKNPPSLAELKRRLQDAERLIGALGGAIKRLRRVAKWARGVGLKALARLLDRRVAELDKRRDGVRDRARTLRRRIRNHGSVPGVDNGWHPEAERNQTHVGIGRFLSVPAKLVWHTTEGSGLPAYSGSHPHFTLDPRTGRLWQHIPIHSGAMTLKNLAGGVETNRAHAIQVELIGFAKDTPGWPREHYEHVAELARWIEKHAGVDRRCGVTFRPAVNHIPADDWLAYRGHIGHQHVPENDHWDPGALRIGEVI